MAGETLLSHCVSSDTRNACATIHPALLPFVEHCLSNDTLNTQGGILEVTKPRGSALEFENGRCCDRFMLGIPYCGTQVSWEVIFDRNEPSQPPDIIFSSDDDRTEFNPNIETLQSLSKWSLHNPKCLSSLLEELLAEYRSHHKSLASLYERLQCELHLLLDSEHYSNFDVHCSIAADSKTFEPVTKFYIPLDIDFSAAPAYLTKDNPGPDVAAVVVTFYPPNGSRAIPSLFLSPRVERMFGGSHTLKLPPLSLNTPLVDYIPRVHKLLKDKVQSIIQTYVQRKEYTAAFLSVFGQSVLEYDTGDFKKLAFMFEYLGFSFIARLELSDGFPQEQPLLILQSIYHRIDGRPCHSIVNNYPYSPRWNADEHAERMRMYLVETAPQFREVSKENGQFF